jgi:hypothetical protein
MAKILNISGTEIKDRGIQKLADYVEDHLTDEFTLVIGCKPSIYDVDAVLIGGGNIYAIECKDWKGTISGGSYGWWQKDGQVIENPLQQARNNAAALGKWLRGKFKNIKGSVWVKGLIVFTHDDIQATLDIDENSLSDIIIIPLDMLTKHVLHEKASVGDNIGINVVNYFSTIGKSSMNTPFMKKRVLIIVTAISVATAFISGYLFISGTRTGIVGGTLLVSGLIISILTKIWSEINGIETRSYFNKIEPLDDFNIYRDHTKDIYNVYGTYDRKK